MIKKQIPFIGSQSNKRDKSTTFLWSINNAKLVISQVVAWILLNVGYLPWLLLAILFFFWQEVSI